jgi:NADPH-dependent 2,4-dienoyl-CoA reductase/sulfur reductase-like enzyme
MPPEHIAIVGASLAGVRTAEALRRIGFIGALTILGDEAHAPYDRPPLSKGYLAGTRQREQLSLHPKSPTLIDIDVTLLTADRVRSVDLAARQLVCESDRTVTFDQLVVASGTRLRALPPEVFTDDAHPPVVGLRTLDDANRLIPLLQDGARIVVIGAGFIGAEVASTAVGTGCRVTVIEAASVPLERQLGAEIGAVCAGLHAAHSVRLLTDTTVVAIDRNGVLTSNGEHIGADAIVVGIGVVPNTEWLDGSGLDLTNGVLCDETLRAHPNVIAVGDIARWPNRRYDETARIEHWTHAVESAEHAAGSLLGGSDAFEPVPYFWSDQYGVKIQCLGRTTGFDEVKVAAGSTDEFKFLALYRRGDRLVAALGASMVRQVMGFRQHLVDRISWDDALRVVGP